MRRVSVFVLCLSMAVLMSGCGGSTAKQDTKQSREANAADQENGTVENADDQENGTVADADVSGQEIGTVEDAADQENVTVEDAGDQKAKPSLKAGKAAGSGGGIDVDLTKLSSTMVYGEVFNMMNAPQDYKGKTIKMTGQYSCYHDEASNKDYFACLIQDATACCSQGVEFIPTDDYHYPEDFPKDGEDVTVVGVFDTYEEDGTVYGTLRQARFV